MIDPTSLNDNEEPDLPQEGSGDEAEGLSPADPLVRMVEAMLFASTEPLDRVQLSARLPSDIDVAQILDVIARTYAPRGVNLVHVAGRWTFRTAPDLAFLLRKDTHEQRKLSRAGVETLAIIAYHQPVTRAEIEEIRGVVVSKGTLDVLLETGWITPRGRRQTPGKPLLFGTTDAFLNHFGLAALQDLPGIEELKAAGMLDAFASVSPTAMEEGLLPEIMDESGPLDEPLEDDLLSLVRQEPPGADDPMEDID
jgi:segregation and condensation protein B